VFPSLTGLPTPLVLLVAAVVLAAESGLMVGVVLPGATAALGLGLLSRLGEVGFGSAVLTVAAASLLGSQLAFLAARRREPVGFGVLRRRAGRVLARGSALLARRPITGAAAGRLVGGVRTVVPVLAARAGVRHAHFAAGDVPAALGWAVLLVGLGNLAGAALDEVRLAVGLVGPPLLLTILAVGYGRKWASRASSSRGTHGAARGRPGVAPVLMQRAHPAPAYLDDDQLPVPVRSGIR
jgi:membrane-associated protein